jgi:hypothetical protein
MLYAANANFFELKDETDLIHKIASDADYKMIHRKLEKDTDYQRIQKILYNIEKFNYSKVNYINSWLTSKPFFLRMANLIVRKKICCMH